MVTGKKRAQNTVKIDESLLKRVKNLVEEEEIRLRYPTVKSFINTAVLKLLKENEAKIKDE